MPGNRGRFQIDYILVKHRFRNSVKDVKVIPSADVYSDHNLLVASIYTTLKRIVSRGSKKTKWDLNKLTSKANEVQQTLEAQFSNVGEKNGSIEEEWIKMKDSVTDTLENLVGKKRKQNKMPWITQEMIDKMAERRKWKNVNTEAGRQMYRRLNNQLRRITDEAKEKYLESKCDEIMILNRQGRYDLMYAKAKELDECKSKAIENGEIENEHREIVNDPNQIKLIWERYIEKLYDKANRPEVIPLEMENEVDKDDMGPSILKCEVMKAIEEMRKGKATGDDEIPVDVLKIMGDNGIQVLTKILNRIYESYNMTLANDH